MTLVVRRTLRPWEVIYSRRRSDSVVIQRSAVYAYSDGLRCARSAGEVPLMGQSGLILERVKLVNVVSPFLQPKRSLRFTTVFAGVRQASIECTLFSVLSRT